MKVGFFINNKTTAGLAEAFLRRQESLPYEAVLLATSEDPIEDVYECRFTDWAKRYVGGDFPWRKRKRFYERCFFYWRAFREIQGERAFCGLSALVLFLDDGSLSRVLALKARDIGLPVICIQEEAIYEWNHAKKVSNLRRGIFDRIARRVEYWIHPELPRGKDKQKGLLADVNIVYGEKKREMLLARGFPEDRIHVLGHPYYDSLRMREPAKSVAMEILFAHQQTFDRLENELDWYQALVDAASEVGVRLIFKLHPRSRTKSSDIRARYSDRENISVIEKGDIQEMTLTCGLFVTGDSAAVNRALADGVVPLLLNGANPFGRRLDLADRGAALSAETPAEARVVVVQFFRDPTLRKACLARREEAIRAYLGPLDGNAGKRYNEVIGEVAWRYGNSDRR